MRPPHSESRGMYKVHQPQPVTSINLKTTKNRERFVGSGESHFYVLATSKFYPPPESRDTGKVNGKE